MPKSNHVHFYQFTFVSNIKSNINFLYMQKKHFAYQSSVCLCILHTGRKLKVIDYIRCFLCTYEFILYVRWCILICVYCMCVCLGKIYTFHKSLKVIFDLQNSIYRFTKSVTPNIFLLLKNICLFLFLRLF